MSNNIPVTPGEMTHALLVAVIMKQGGSVVLGPEDYEPDAMGHANGQLYALEMTPLTGGRVRLSVVPRPDQEQPRVVD